MLCSQPRGVLGCPREHGMIGRCKKPGGKMSETERPKLDVASSIVGTVLGVKGTTRKCLGESCLKWSKTETRRNQMIQCLNLLPVPLAFTTGDIFHHRIYALESCKDFQNKQLDSSTAISLDPELRGHNPSQLQWQHGPEACIDFWNTKCSVKPSG